MGSCYHQIPIHLMPPFAFPDEPASLLYLINLTAGLLDGDGHLIQLAVREGTRSVVTGQSATRVHPAIDSFATQQWEVSVEDDAMLVALPGPTIPYKGSRYHQRGRVDLAPTARLVWGDIWLAGRYARGELSERYQFDRIVQDLEIRRAGRLVYRDRFHWRGPWNEAEIDWFAGGQLATGGLFISGPDPVELPPSGAGVRRAVLPLDSEGCCVRWCGSPAAVMAELVHAAMSVAGRWTGGRPWLLESTSLTPNHWFSTPPA